MIEPNVLAFQNIPLLEAIEEKTGGQWGFAELAAHMGRDKSNTRRTCLALTAEGILQDPPLAGLTDEGRAQVAAYKRAKHGGERRKAQGRWPLDKFRRNPLNRAIDPEAVLGLADTVLGVGDILMPLVVSAPDGEGVRTIWAGERRWVAATRLLQLGQLPEALLQGLPFTERAATKGEAAVIALIENGAREDMNPWQDAQQLRIAADEENLNATELARKIGRARDGDRGGLRDVQAKIKVAREATPEAIAAYEADPSAPGAWEALRDSVSKPKPKPEPEIVLTKGQRLALAELIHKSSKGREVVRILPAAHSEEGARLVQYELATLIRRDTGDTAFPTSKGLTYAEAEGLIGYLPTIREQMGIPPRHGSTAYTTAWLNTEPPGAPATAPGADSETAALVGIEPISVEPSVTRAGFADGVSDLPFVGFEPPMQMIAAAAIADRLAEARLTSPHTVSVPITGWTLEDGEAWPAEPTDRAVTWWSGERPNAKIDLYASSHERWGYSLSVTDGGPSHHYAGDASGVRSADPIFVDKASALRHAARRIRKHCTEGMTAKMQSWLESILNPDGVPYVVAGVRYPNASRAEEARIVQGIKKSQANHSSTDGARRAPIASTDTIAAAKADPISAPQILPALALVRMERDRQVEAEGWTAEYDDEVNGDGELAQAAAAYACGSCGDPDASLFWPSGWDPYAFSPTGTIRDLVKAGALILAEIERRQRNGDA